MNMIEIPIIEDIYDLDTITLQEVTQLIETTLLTIENTQGDNNQNSLLWLKKARKFIHLAGNEIEERKAVENFGNICALNDNSNNLMQNITNLPNSKRPSFYDHSHTSPLNKINNSNNLFGNVNEWIQIHQQLSQQTETCSSTSKKSHQQLLQSHYDYSVRDQIKECEQEDDDENQLNTYAFETFNEEIHDNCESNKQSEQPDSLNSSSEIKKKKSDNSFIDNQINNLANTSILSSSSQKSSVSSHIKYLAHQKKLKNKNTQQNEMQEFIRMTLEKTRITQNCAINSGQQLSQQIYHRTTSLVEVEERERNRITGKKKTKKTTGSLSATSSSLSIRPRIDDRSHISNEYAGIESKIKLDLEQQKLKKLDTPYFTTGQYSYPKYKPPLQKKIDPIEERKNKTKNFLKKSEPSLLVLPPIFQTKKTIQLDVSNGLTMTNPKINFDLNLQAATLDIISDQIQLNTKFTIKVDKNTHIENDDIIQTRNGEQIKDFNQIDNNLQNNCNQIRVCLQKQNQADFQKFQSASSVGLEHVSLSSTVMISNISQRDIRSLNCISQDLHNHNTHEIEILPQQIYNFIQQNEGYQDNQLQEEVINKRNEISEEKYLLDDLNSVSKDGEKESDNRIKREREDDFLSNLEEQKGQLKRENLVANQNNLQRTHAVFDTDIKIDENKERNELLNEECIQIKQQLVKNEPQIVQQEIKVDGYDVKKEQKSNEISVFEETIFAQQLNRQDYYDALEENETKVQKIDEELLKKSLTVQVNKETNEQLRYKMEKLINSFQQNKIDADIAEQTNQKEQQQINDIIIKKSKNQIFGRPSSSTKRKALGVDVKISAQIGQTDEQSVSFRRKTIDMKEESQKTQINVLKTIQVEVVQKRKEEKDVIVKQDIFVKKKIQPLKVPSMASKLMMKMMKEISDDTLVDYSSVIPSFSHLFSGYFNTLWRQSNPMMGGNCGSSLTMNITGGGNFCLIDQMRDILLMFQQHVEKVDNGDKGLLRYKQVITPLDMLPSEVYYQNDPQKVVVYQNRVDIDMRRFIERQIIFTQRVNGENFGCHLLPHEEFYYRVVKNKQEVYDIISRSFMRKQNWFELPHGLSLKTSWNLLWTWSKPQIDFNKLLVFQKVNHFPFNKNLVRKDLLKKNFERITKLGAKAANVFNILPLTFVLPKEYCNFSEKFYEEMLVEGENNIWIMKPVGKSQGRGISLVNDIAQVVYAEPVVVQKYMKNPLLLDGFKFDMRIYALITHMKPLEAFVYKEGFARLSTEKYTLNAQNIRNNQIHLTNYSIQKHHYDPSSSTNFIGGTKISLRMLQDKLKQRAIDWDKIWTQIEEIIVKSILACQADIPNNPNCFEIFGYDIIIDSNLKCILLEINSSPSLARDFIIDDLIKQQMIDDAIDLISPVQFDRLRLLEVFDRRIREEQGNKSNINTTNNSKLQLNRDLNYILRGQQLRIVGEQPRFIGQWQKVAPTVMSDKYLKLIQSYKLPSVRSNTSNASNNNNTID